MSSDLSSTTTKKNLNKKMQHEKFTKVQKYAFDSDLILTL